MDQHSDSFQAGRWGQVKQDKGEFSAEKIEAKRLREDGRVPTPSLLTGNSYF